MVLTVFTYVYKTVVTEIVETSFILKDIFYYHTLDLFEKLELNRQKKELKKCLKKAKSLQEWKKFADEFDNLKDVKNWRENLYSNTYDYEYILNLKDELKKAREIDDFPALIHLIRSNAVRNLVFYDYFFY